MDFAKSKNKIWINLRMSLDGLIVFLEIFILREIREVGLILDNIRDFRSKALVLCDTRFSRYLTVDSHRTIERWLRLVF